MIKPETAKQRYIARWKREHRRKTHFGGCLKMSYNVPGTYEFWALALLVKIEPSFFPADGEPVR